MSFLGVKRFVALLMGVAVFAFAMLLVYCLQDEFFLQGQRHTKSYYLYSQSSLARRVQTVELWELPFVEGCSVCVEFSSEAEAREYALELAKKRKARLQRLEFLDGVESYYYFCSDGGASIVVGGVPINLQIALRGRFVNVGKPIVFGGY